MVTLKQDWAWYLRIYVAFICSLLIEYTLSSVCWKDAMDKSADIFLSSAFVISVWISAFRV